MPLYEYKCLSCGTKFEVLQKFSDDPIATHAGCGGVAERLISSSSFHFKGTGWYATDYAKANGSPDKPGSGKDGDAKPADSGSGESKPDSTPKTEATTAKTETKPAVPAAASDSK